MKTLDEWIESDCSRLGQEIKGHIEMNNHLHFCVMSAIYAYFHHRCLKCLKGNLVIQNSEYFCSSPPMFLHICNRCGQQYTRSKFYIEHESVLNEWVTKKCQNLAEDIQCHIDCIESDNESLYRCIMISIRQFCEDNGYSVDFKVKYIGCDDDQAFGYPKKEGFTDPRPLLTVGQEYDLEYAVIHDWHTVYVLEGYKNLGFNSVCFESDYPAIYKAYTTKSIL